MTALISLVIATFGIYGFENYFLGLGYMFTAAVACGFADGFWSTDENPRPD